MQNRATRGTRWKVAGTLAATLLLIITSLAFTFNDESTSNLKAPEWTYNLPSAGCPWNWSETYCHHSSPVLADLTGDGKLEIVVATNKGYVVALRHNGTVLWQTDVAPAFGMRPGTQRIASSPAVADLENDGRPEIVVGVGTIHSTICTQGGVIVLTHDGRVKSGWPFLAQDQEVPPAGCRDTVFATPALGDMDLNGDLEIVFGGFDKRLYALHHTGHLLSAFPPNSNLLARFIDWPNLVGKLADDMWSSPALADLDGDGYLDIITGTGEGNFDNTWNPPMGNWSCPYRPPTTRGYCGGSIYAVNLRGQLLPGFPRYLLEAIDSTPAAVDINDDGRSEFFIGAGSFYYRTSPDHPQYGFRLFGFDSQGKDLPGWQGGKAVGGVVTASPSIGDIDGDGQPEVVVAARDKRLYAWEVDGRAVPGFPMTPVNHFGQVLDPYDVGTSFILADYTGDGKMEIFLRHAWEIIIVDGAGRQLTAPNPHDARPVYNTDGPLWNNPAVGDLDGDGHLELVVQNSKLTVWDLPQSSTLADWPVFKGDAARRSHYGGGALRVAPEQITLMAEAGRRAQFQENLMLYGYQTGVTWRATSDRPDAITFPRASGPLGGQQLLQAAISVPGGLPVGERTLGNITIEALRNGEVQEKETIPVMVNVVRELDHAFLPYVP